MLQNKKDNLINDGYDVEKDGHIIHKDYKPSTLRKIKAALVKAYKAAEDNEAVSKNLAEGIDITAKAPGESFSPISLDFIPKLFYYADCGDEDAMKLLINIYTGLRPNEMTKLSKNHVFFEAGYIYGMGSKTDNGKERKIPIFSKIKGYLKYLYMKTDKYILGSRMDVKQYRENFFYPAMGKFKYKEKVVPYSCRHTFADILDKYKIDKEVIKQVMGHSSFNN